MYQHIQGQLIIEYRLTSQTEASGVLIFFGNIILDIALSHDNAGAPNYSEEHHSWSS